MVLIVTVVLLALGLLTSLWYNLRRYFASERAVETANAEAASEKALRESAEKEADKQEAARLAENEKARDRDVREATATAGDAQLSFDFLQNSFPSHQNRNRSR